MKFEKTEVFNFYGALRGMRNPMNSWDKGDSGYIDRRFNDQFFIGKNDLDLAQRLIKAGSEHRKFLRQIFVSVDITAPLYWWKEADQYRIGITTNSCSTMHKLASTSITMDCFEMDDFEDTVLFMLDEDELDDSIGLSELWEKLIKRLERMRVLYNETKDKRYWKELIRLLPESWLQKRTITMNYENVLNMYHQRCVHPHKLTEWSVSFKDWAESLPYAKQFFIKPFEKKRKRNAGCISKKGVSN